MAVKQALGVWLRQVRAPFLILAVALALLGIASAHWHGFDHAGHSLLLVVGVVLAHAAVNLFNELSDHGTGIDENTARTPFSGGSGMLQAGKTTPRQVRLAAYGSLLAAGAIGLYFCLVSGWPLLVLMACGALAIRFYTSHLARWLDRRAGQRPDPGQLRGHRRPLCPDGFHDRDILYHLAAARAADGAASFPERVSRRRSRPPRRPAPPGHPVRQEKKRLRSMPGASCWCSP